MKMNKNIVIIQARMGSSRMYGKVLKQVCGKTFLNHQIRRLRYSKEIDGIIVATTTRTIDDPIEIECKNNKILCYRGSENDVLDRYYQTARNFKLEKDDGIVRITGDCPLIDPNVVDEVIKLFNKTNSDYASNVDPPTFPDGLDTEVFKFSTLERAWREAKMSSEREHVTTYILNHKQYFKIANLKNDINLEHLRWTLDENEDFKFIKYIYERLYDNNSLFLTKDIIQLLKDNPQIGLINNKFKRNEGLQRSLISDGEV
jgi:spore coat polysaccharide biosynthesis protein SpsF